MRISPVIAIVAGMVVAKNCEDSLLADIEKFAYFCVRLVWMQFEIINELLVAAGLDTTSLLHALF